MTCREEGVTKREGGGYEARGEACENARPQVDVTAKVQSSEWHLGTAYKIVSRHSDIRRRCMSTTCGKCRVHRTFGKICCSV